MLDVRRFLRLLRPAGAPGSAGAVGVPADRRSELEAELQPVFDALAGAEAGCARQGAAASRRGGSLGREAAAEVARLLAEADARAPAVQAEALDRVLRRETQRMGDPMAEARREMARVSEQARRLMPGMVAEVTAGVRRTGASVGNDAGSEAGGSG